MTEKSGKYGDLIRQAKQPNNQTTRKPESQKEERQVNLCVKVPLSWRKHWVIQAKTEDTTMTEVMVEALKSRFGLPDSQKTR